MLELYNFGLSDFEIKDMIEICPEILELSKPEILNNIDLLNNIGCSERCIKNIITSNPFYLNRTLEDIISLINKLIKIGVTNIDLLFDSNPFLLNKDAYEIDEYINIEKNKGKSLSDIVEEFESNPCIIDEN